MKKWPSKKTIISISIIVIVILLLVVAGAFVTLRVTCKPERGQKITITVDDLAEMKTLAHGYLNQRTRMLISSEPDYDPNIAGSPVISPTDMSPELAQRQKEDVEKLKARTIPGLWKNFAILANAFSIQEKEDKVVLGLEKSTFLQLSDQLSTPGPGHDYSAMADDYYFTFSRIGDRWILTDVKIPFVGNLPPDIEPSVKPLESGTDRVLANPPESRYEEGFVVPEELKKLDSEATEKIKNRWAIDNKTAQEIESGTYSW
ncbi:MAG: hypothetical protein JW738_07580 [Actinobacteria bacterium]|nr:hypothetical protein [Actinomycetota bacterium]